MRIFAFILFIISLSLVGKAQEHNPYKKHTHEDEHNHSGHIHNDIGFASGLVYIPEEKEFHSGIHVHVIKGLMDNLGFGLGYEAVFADHYHHSVNFIINIGITEHWRINVGPGLNLPAKKGDSANMNIHVETVYSWTRKNIHIGPMLGYGKDDHEKHFTAGVHIGIGF